MEEQQPVVKKKLFTISNIVLTLLVVVLLAILTIIIRGSMIRADTINESKSTMVCNNLEMLNANNNIEVFPDLITRKTEVEKAYGGRITEIYGNTTKAKMFNVFGVMCQVNIELCDNGYVICQDLKMVVPVNYTEWQTWQDTFETGYGKKVK